MKWYVVGALGLLASCAAEPETVIATGRPIINGEIDTIPSHISVVALRTLGGFPFCTGTYIGNRTIVSAAHCVDGVGAEDVRIFFGTNANSNNGLSVDVEDIATFGYNPATLKKDMSVLRMVEEPVINGQPIVPIRMASFIEGTELTAADEGQPISFAGYGVTDGATQTGGGLRMVVNPDYREAPQGIVLNSVGPDGSLGLDLNQVHYLQPDAGGGPCNGDSGGPMFVRRGGVEFLAATTSFGDQGCNVFGVSTRTDTFEADICNFAGEEALGCGGNPLVPELCTNGLDDDGDGAIDCEDAQCSDDLACRELCGNGVDDNNDGEVDCGDPECATSALCAEDCDNGTDDDSDGDLDCEDSDCVGNAACVENCTNGSDDDGDGAVDCDDVVDCSSNAACQVAQELCKNFADDDGDGAVDCDDSDCADFEDCQVAPPAEEGCAVAPSSNSAPGALLFLFFLSCAFLSRRRLF